MRYSHVPVGEGHHDVERGQEEAEVEEGVVVGHSLLLVVHGTPNPPLVWGVIHIHGQTLPLLRLHQPVDLSVVGGADAAERTASRLVCTITSASSTAAPYLA